MGGLRLLIRRGYVATMHRPIGVRSDADVLVQGDRIAAVARSLDADDAEVIDARGSVVLPGMVDTHRHTWQTLMRGICANWTLNDYFNGMRLIISPAYSAQDVYLGNYLGAVDAINSGATTILDFSHCVNSPEHGDAAIAGLRDAGIRALFGYGFFDSKPREHAFPDHAESQRRPFRNQPAGSRDRERRARGVWSRKIRSRKARGCRRHASRLSLRHHARAN